VPLGGLPRFSGLRFYEPNPSGSGRRYGLTPHSKRETANAVIVKSFRCTVVHTCTGILIFKLFKLRDDDAIGIPCLLLLESQPRGLP
jgi:hypothetical protein